MRVVTPWSFSRSLFSCECVARGHKQKSAKKFVADQSDTFWVYFCGCERVSAASCLPRESDSNATAERIVKKKVAFQKRFARDIDPEQAAITASHMPKKIADNCCASAGFAENALGREILQPGDHEEKTRP